MKHLTMLAICAGLAIAGCGDEDSDNDATPNNGPAAADTTTQEQAPRDDSVERCERSGQTVDEYDITRSGASREEYLTLLHKLQRECPEQAEELGLTGEGLPECEPGQLEDCTEYRQR